MLQEALVLAGASFETRLAALLRMRAQEWPDPPDYGLS
jgi:hypothetical protein